MPIVKSIIIAAGLAAGITLAAQAQTASGPTSPGVSIANLPPAGPRASSQHSIPGTSPQAVAPSGRYPGPKAGGSSVPATPRFQKSAEWNANAALHPYDGKNAAPVGGGR